MIRYQDIANASPNDLAKGIYVTPTITQKPEGEYIHLSYKLPRMYWKFPATLGSGTFFKRGNEIEVDKFYPKERIEDEERRGIGSIAYLKTLQFLRDKYKGENLTIVFWENTQESRAWLNVIFGKDVTGGISLEESISRLSTYLKRKGVENI